MIPSKLFVVFCLYTFYFAGAVLLLIVHKCKNDGKFIKLKSYQQFYWTFVLFIPLNMCSFFLSVAYILCDSLKWPLYLLEFYGHWYLVSMAIFSTFVTRMFLMFIIWYLTRFLFKKSLARLVIRKNWLIWTCSALYALANHETFRSDMFQYNGINYKGPKTLDVSVCDITLSFISYSIVFWKVYKMIRYHNLKKTSPDSKIQLAICTVPLIMLTVIQTSRFLFLNFCSNDPNFLEDISKWHLITWLPFIHTVPFSAVYVIHFF